MTPSAKIIPAKQLKRKPLPKTGFAELVNKPGFAKFYLFFSLIVLLASTTFWATKSTLLQSSNADQLVNPLLLENMQTFQGSIYPGAHSLLLKWPLFFIIRLFGASGGAYLGVTLVVVVATVAILALILYRIERRPLVFGSLCLALASTLLLVPAQPYAGALLPVNMAMLATRNLEYVVFIASLIILIKSPRFKSPGFWLSVSCLSLLVASDKLFLTLGVMGAVLGIVAYTLVRGWKLVSLSVYWLMASLLSAIGAIVVLSLLQAGRLGHIASQAGSGPFSLAHGLHDLALGVLYAAMGLLSNFGANPAYGVVIVRDIPHKLLSGLALPGGLAFAVNGILLAAGLFMAYGLVRSSLKHRHNSKKSRLDKDALLSIMLVWSSLAAIGAFVATGHYYAVDARYLGITFFAVFVAAATYLSKRSWPAERVVLAGGLILIGIICGVFASASIFKAGQAALAGVNERNATITQALRGHQSKILVGDYWRVLPVKQAYGKNLVITPLDGCTHARQALTSRAWQPDLNKHGFVYLLTLDGGLTDYSNCSLKQVIDAYGRPNASVTISGSLQKPRELLLFYDHGIRKSAPLRGSNAQALAGVIPVPLPEITIANCDRPTTMNIVAHQDDDLLFMSPDLIHDIEAGRCVRTVYVTAGDSGAGKFYWLGREQGSEAAYSKMLGGRQLWVQRTARLANNQFVTLASPRGNHNISLVFMHLPDGNLHGQGFKASKYASLASLEAGKIGSITSTSGQSNYNSTQLVSALAALMNFFQPTEIRTQANLANLKYPDHSDHLEVGHYVKRAYEEYETKRFENKLVIPLKFYIGYPVQGLPANVAGDDLKQKKAAYFAYSVLDNAVCHTEQQCNNASTLGKYLERQYANPY